MIGYADGGYINGLLTEREVYPVKYQTEVFQ